MTERILITGAAGGLGSLMRPRLARSGRELRLLDVATPTDPAPHEEVVTASVTDAAAVAEAMRGVSAVIHLGGHSLEGPWEDILDVNIHGSYVVLEQARLAGVPRVVLASSNHAVGFHPRVPEVPDYAFPRPDTFYGVSKVALEALGSLYHDSFGMDVIAVRVGSCFEKPKDTRMLDHWMSPDDGGRLFEACLSAPSPGFRVVWGVSDNTRRWTSLDAARALGYEPQDDSEVYAEEKRAAEGAPDLDSPPHNQVGGYWRLAAADPENRTPRIDRG
ncbi:NAD-dependent epimerase/dehydratase family protein [Streptomonospora wellingtoniae]|uniref:NAD(P)-dependent oxidoreductase n=1 Tax=Streptomonospora wellingtoniae TaxID=3075544 RepID=A0ABU2KNP6_9ACTN|nr:NAD(P)-dependent oxidoreductase [Streptomonospora sp. DSM 45055]MDT0300895.1 NAD(P)-dependent oxidoreductase [Streptomonospora sp. DSM 45055]